MKFCAVICEYNPFHNGHKYQLGEIKRLSGCDKVLCIMSGNFTQRGNVAVFDKYTRARHAVENGADVVLELPTAFAVSPAELFAGGALHILASIPAVKTLAFGCESGTKEEFLTAARAALGEDKQFKALLKENMKGGTSYVKARTDALLALHPETDAKLFSSPNNLLGVEYCRAILSENADIEPLPIPRVGGGFHDTTLQKNYSSASALRTALGEDTMKARRALKSNVPPTVYDSALSYSPTAYETAALLALLSTPAEEVAKTPDCAEGLENRLQSMARLNPAYADLLEKVVSKRYTRSRIKRILLQNFLGVHLANVREFLAAPLYCRTLAVKKDGAEEILSALSEGRSPLVARKSDSFLLKKDAADCFRLDLNANDLYGVLRGTHFSEYETVFVD